MRVAWLVCALVLLVGCATPQVSLPAGVASIMYAQARSDYAVAKVVATQACAKGRLDKATCESLTLVDARTQVLRQNIEQALINPTIPIDWGQVLQYTESVMSMVLKMGLLP
jgi:hypothetical protein